MKQIKMACWNCGQKVFSLNVRASREDSSKAVHVCSDCSGAFGVYTRVYTREELARR